jgi:ATP synthase protein I
MTHDRNSKKSLTQFVRKVAAQETRKIRARRGKNQIIWFGLGLLGLVGWSVVTPTLLGTALGIWIDTQFPSQFSWTIMLMFGGLILGCLNAWHWVSREQAQMTRSQQQGESEKVEEEDNKK